MEASDLGLSPDSGLKFPAFFSVSGACVGCMWGFRLLCQMHQDDFGAAVLVCAGKSRSPRARSGWEGPGHSALLLGCVCEPWASWSRGGVGDK